MTGGTIHHIGEVPFNGIQHGVGIFYTGASGQISGNTVSQYQKGGIVAGTAASHDQRQHRDRPGRIDYIAQNGIQVSFGTSARLFGNDVSLNNYTPPRSPRCGLLIYKAGGVSGAAKAGIAYIKADNNFHDNETDIFNNGKGERSASSPALARFTRSAVHEGGGGDPPPSGIPRGGRFLADRIARSHPGAVIARQPRLD